MNIKYIPFDNKERGGKVINPRIYDVRITLNKSGKVGFVIRFGFLNAAVKAFEGKNYIQVSKVEVLQNRIYFRAFDEKKYVDVYKLCTNPKSKSRNLYVAMKPSAAAEKIYRAKWINKTFYLQFDDECGLYYVQLAGEEE